MAECPRLWNWVRRERDDRALLRQFFLPDPPFLATILFVTDGQLTAHRRRPYYDSVQELERTQGDLSYFRFFSM